MSKYIDGSGLTYLWSKIKAYIQSLNYTSNIGTVTGITMNNTSYSPVNGDVDIGTVVTDVSSKANDADVVHITGDETIAGDKTFTGTITGVDIYGDLYGGVYTSWAEIEHGIIVPPVNGNSGTLTLASANDGNAQLVVGNSQGNPEGGTLEEQATGGWTQLYNSVTDKTLQDELDERNNVQADWSQTTTTSLDYIKNKPSIITDTYGHTSIGNNNISITGGSVTITDSKNSILLDNAGDNGIQITANDGSDGTISLTASSTISLNTTGTNKAYYNNKEIATKSDIPTVYAWAQAATKPSYTAADVGAVPTTRTINGKALSADITLSASDVSALPSSTVIPSAPGTLDTTATTAQSTNSSEALSGNVTLHKVAKTGAYSDLIGTPTIPTISTDIISDGIDDTKTASPKAVKTFVEGKGYLTSETEPDFNGSAAASITSANITAWNGKQDALIFNTAYNASSNKVATMSDIPSAVTENTVSGWGFTKNAGTLTGITMNGNSVSVTSGVADLGTVITAHQSLANYVQKSNTNGLLKNDGTVDQNVYLTTETEPAYTQSAAATLTSSNIVKGASQSYTIWSGTQQEYDAITTKDNNTLYFIKES